MVERLRHAAVAAVPDLAPASAPDAAATSPPWAMGDPGPRGRFGSFGGRFVPEALVPACEQLEAAFGAAWADTGFRARLAGLLRSYAGRPTPVTEATRLSEATVAAHLGLGCTVYMGAKDIARQELNVFRMELLGAAVVPVTSGTRTLKDATSEALRHWVTTVDSTHYCIGSLLGPHPYPWLVREFQRVIGDEARAQCAELLSGAGPDVVVACVGGGSNAAGTFAGFVATSARLVGVEAAGGAAVTAGRPGVLHGSLSSFLQDEDGQIAEAHAGDVAGGATVLITMSGRGDKDAACLTELVRGRR